MGTKLETFFCNDSFYVGCSWVCSYCSPELEVEFRERLTKVRPNTSPVSWEKTQ